MGRWACVCPAGLQHTGAEELGRVRLLCARRHWGGAGLREGPTPHPPPCTGWVQFPHVASSGWGGQGAAEEGVAMVPG